MLKRCFDLLTASVLIILTMPLLVLGGSIVLLVSGRPVFFCQTRPGYKGKLFTVYKLRTMQILFDERGQLMPDKDRLPAWGKALRAASLDELPQLFNVLKGDMSLVGPRPLLAEYLSLYSENQMRRHDVLPGITGLAQINGRNNLDWDQRLKLDVWYVDNRTFWLDLKILMLTVIKALKNEGVNKTGEATVDKFKGNQRSE